jgi:hypothetical protein
VDESSHQPPQRPLRAQFASRLAGCHRTRTILDRVCADGAEVDESSHLSPHRPRGSPSVGAPDVIASAPYFTESVRMERWWLSPLITPCINPGTARGGAVRQQAHMMTPHAHHI